MVQKIMNPYTPNAQVRGAYLLCFGVFDRSLVPQKTYFYEEAQRRGVQNDFIYNYLLLLDGWRPKNVIFQNFLHLENVVFQGP